MSRRHILEDSDDDGHSGGGRTVTPSGDFFTDEEKEAIDKCKIQTNDNWGIYSDDYTSRAIAKVGEPPLETVVQDRNRLLYQKYRVKPGSERVFFERDVYKVHGPKPDASCDPECLEEAILLEIEAIRRSEKAAKNRMFRNKETGGMVIFGPWFNYALQRLLRLSSSDVGRTATAASLGEYTAVKIIRSLFSFITEDLKEVIKPGQLHRLKSTMGVDWEKNLNTARKVINHCGGSDHFLYNEFAILEAHVESLKSKTKPPPPAAAVSLSSSASNTAMLAAPAKQAQVNADAHSNARNARMALMRAQAFAHSLGNATVPPHTTVSASSSADDGWGRRSQPSAHLPGSATAPPHTTGYASSDGWGRRSQPSAHLPGGATASPHTAVSESSSVDDGWGRKRDGESAARPHIPARAISNGGRTNMESSTTQPYNPSRATSHGDQSKMESTSTQSYNFTDRATSCGGQSTMESTTSQPVNRVTSNGGQSDKISSSAPGLGITSNGWGRVRDGNSANQPYKTKGSWKFARHILGFNIPVNNASLEPSQRAQNYDCAAPQQEAFARASERTPPAALAASRDNISARDDNVHGHENHNRGGNIYNPPSRSDDYSSRSVGSRSSGRFDDRSSDDRDPDGGRDNRAYHRNSSRGSDREDYPSSNSRRGDYSRDSYRDEEYHSSRSREGSFRDYSGHPAQGSKHSRSDDYNDMDVRPAKIFRGPSATSGPQARVSNAPIPDSAGTGRGRGAHVNQPAWMKKQQQPSAHDGPTEMQGNIVVTANSFAAMAYPTASSGPDLLSSSSNAPGSGMRRGRDMNLPDWMARQESAPSNEFSEMGQQAPSVTPRATPAIILHHPLGESTSNGQGRGRGRGRGGNKNLPAWMTNPSNP